MKKLVIFDTTLRDGEQSPGCTMTLDEKMRVLEQLIRLNVSVIEAGFPASSPGDFEAVKQIATRCDFEGAPIVCALSRLEKADIDAAIAAITPARNKRIHVFIATSSVQMNTKFNDGAMSESALQILVLDRIEWLVEYASKLAKEIGAEVEFSAEDATRSKPHFLLKCFQTAINAGAKILNVPDTVGYTMPDEYHQLISRLALGLIAKDGRPLWAALETNDYIISAHCHNDLGMAVANSLAALKAGARQVECTIGGIGERCGNAALESIMMALTTRHDFYKIDHDINISELTRAVEVVEEVTEFKREITHPIVGKNAFAHEAGIHSAAVIKDATTYEIMLPESVGQKRNIVLGKHAGRNAFRHRIVQLGLYSILAETDLERENVIAKVVKACKSWADDNKLIPDSQLIKIVAKIAFDLELKEDFHDAQDHLVAIYNFRGTWTPPLKFLTYHIESQHDDIYRLNVEVDVMGNRRTVLMEDKGLINTLFQACQGSSGLAEVILEKYHVDSIENQGSASLGRAWCKVRHANDVVEAVGVDVDINRASALAFIQALNKLLLALHLRDLQDLKI